MSAFGGGGTKCVICDKTAYPAETVVHEKKPYHVDCFACTICTKKMEGGSKAALYKNSETDETTLMCTGCFSKGGYAQKQKKVIWTKKESTTSATASKYGGGGLKCKICAKTVYAAETVSYEKEPYHPGCFKCSACDKKMVPANAAAFDDKLYCVKCFATNGLNQKQAASSKKHTASGTTNAMASKFGGGGSKCKACDTTVYSAEAVSYDKIIYHPKCFKCSKCSKQMTPAGAACFEDTLYCSKCFQDEGLHRKQAEGKKASGEPATVNPLASKFGGGGTACVTCSKSVYPAELVSYEKQAYHADCFTCKLCTNKMNVNTAQGKKREDGSVDVYCGKCWTSEGLGRADNNN